MFNFKLIKQFLNAKGIVLVAVTKNRTVSEINQLIALGVTHIGENRIQEFSEKAAIINPVKKHFIGHLQSNKAKDAVKMFDFIDSVDSFKIAKKISDNSVLLRKRMMVMIQVNIGRETQKHGVMPEQAIGLYEKIKELPGIEIAGLMCIAPKDKDARPYFKEMKKINEKLKLKYLSMGMTDDYETAIEEGSNIVRIGRALFV